MNFFTDIRANIWKMYLIKGIRYFLLVIPVIVLFYQENGLTMKEIFLLQSIYSVFVIIFEVPSGYFSDVIGRKITINIACIVALFGFLTYAFSSSFLGFLIAELLLGFASSFMSGTDSAIMYDSLVQAGEPGEYKKVEGRLVSFAAMSEAVASVLGGFLAVVSLRLPFIIEALIMVFTIPVALTLVEPERMKFPKEKNPFSEMKKIVKFSMHHNSEIKWLILYSGFLSASTLTMVWLNQPYFQEVGLPVAYFGVVWAVFNLSVGVFSLFAHRIENFMGRRKALRTLILLPFLGYVLLSAFHSIWAIAFILLFYFVRAVHKPLLNDYVNRLVTSDMRATVLSVKGLVGRLVFAGIGPLIGWITDVYTLQMALMMTAGIYVTFGIVTLLFLRKHKAM